MKSYGGLKAVDDVSFEIYTGEIFALVGDNGAGKSTLMSIVYGLYQADSGSISINNKEINNGIFVADINHLVYLYLIFCRK